MGSPLWPLTDTMARRRGRRYTFIKLGQTMSTRPDVSPEPYVAELARLQYDPTPMPWARIEPVLDIIRCARRLERLTEWARSLGAVRLTGGFAESLGSRTRKGADAAAEPSKDVEEIAVPEDKLDAAPEGVNGPRGIRAGGC